MIEVFKIEAKEDLEEAFKIREKVFVIEQKVDKKDEYDEFEDSSTHFLAIENGSFLGTARWRINGDKIKLERFAVLKEAREKGVGTALIDSIVDDIRVSNVKGQIYLHAQVHAVPFYEKQGFKKQGNLFLECDIEHYAMIK